MNDLLAGTSLIIGIAAANAAQEEIGFKEFLESTPPIEELVYEVVPSDKKPLGAASFGPQQFYGQLPVTPFVVLPSGAYFQNQSNRWERMLPPDSPLIYDPELEKLKKNPPKSLF
jgi:hypothetical protein